MFRCLRSTAPAQTKIRSLNFTTIESTNQKGGDDDGNDRRKERDGSPEYRVACGMDCGAHGVVEQGEGIHAAARRTEPAAAGIALGKGEEGIRVRRAHGQRDARRSLWRQKPAADLSLHARSGMGGRLPELLVCGGSF